MIVPSYRRWFRFSLRTLLIATLVVGALMGWVVKERRQSAREHEIVKSLSSRKIFVEFCGPYDEAQDPSTQAWWRNVTHDVFGTRAVFIAIGDNEFRDLNALAGFTKLKAVHVKGTRVSDITPLAGLKELIGIDLRDSEVRDITPLTSLKNLMHLKLDGTPVRDLSPLRKLTSLKSISLNDTRVTDLSPLAELDNLVGIQLNGTKVTDIMPLVGLKNLQFLDVGSASVPDEQIEALKRALPKCKMDR